MTTDVRRRFTFRLPGELFKVVREESEKQGVSVNALILQILWEWMEKNDKETE